MIERYLSPSELRRLLSALLVVALFLCILTLFAFLIVPGTRNANAPAAEVPVAAPQGQSGWLDPTAYLAEKGRTVPPIDPRTVMSPNPELMARGKAIYVQTCATCHGAEGQGDGPGAKGLNPAPRRFTQKEGWKNGPGIPEIFQTLEKGVPGSSMVSYNYLSKRDRMALVHAVQSLGRFARAQEDPKALEGLARLFATAGETIPNRVPVAKALTLIAKESQPVARLDLRDPAVRAAVLDPERAAQTLALLPGWRQSVERLASGLSQGLPGNGFSPMVATYSREEWGVLHRALVTP
ncbi:c-type cytochrome [Holophaga foetida]|uniref:c-type cytochrome n=1 Tax=Holophaga foetida TaxID=35839 RepID=UPI0002472EF8|nr:cytochrome c [Holophaga foetida]